MTSYAVISSNLAPNYAWYLPLTCLAWRDCCGLEPLVLLVGERAAWEADKVGGPALAYAERAGARVAFVPELAGYRSGTVAQVVRLFACCADVQPEDALTTVDIDMWPLSREPFAPMPADDGLVLFYSNGCNDGTYPMCYLRAAAQTWRAIMRPTAADLGSNVQEMLDRMVGPAGHDYWAEWYADQRGFAKRVRAWDGHPGRCQMIPRDGHPPIDRIWYGHWPRPLPPHLVDAHLVSQNNRAPWEHLRELLVYAGVQDLALADAYAKETA